MPVDAWDDARVRAGMEVLLARRQELLDAGAEPVGWKVAFGGQAAREALGLTGPLVGYLTSATLLASGGECDVGAWTAPKLEPEIAIHIGAPDRPVGGPTIAGVSAAIELADADTPPPEIQSVLEGDIYHRRVVLSAAAHVERPDGPIVVAVTLDGEQVAATRDGEEATGNLPALIEYVGRYLSRFGTELQPGDVVISGSTVPPIDISSGQSYRSMLAGIGTVEVTIT